VALFFDGKNFYSGWKDRAAGRRIRFGRMSDWLVRQTGGASLWGAYYYTGIETGAGLNQEGQKRLASFLHMLELEPGFFVRRFARKSKLLRCKSCGEENRYTHDREMDTQMVADMLRLAATNAFDAMVLISGDGDHAPAVEAVRALGKQAYVATWGGGGLSSRLRQAAFNHLDLIKGMASFEDADGAAASSLPSPVTSPGTPAPATPMTPEDAALVFMDELKRAEHKFQGGYLGLNYFVTRWRSDRLDASPDVRRRLLDRLAAENKVEIYAAPDGTKAIKTKLA